MRFNVLGALQVVDSDGRAIPIRSAKQRALLSRLLCTPGRSVAVDRLVDDLWEISPGSAAKNLQVYVHRLRRLLGEDRIEFQSPGYLIRVEPGDVDAVEFETLTAHGREAMQAKDFEAASTLLGSALALWRGDAFADIGDIDPIRTEAARLDELRLVATEDRIDADLARGDHATAIAVLPRLVALHPLRERLRGQQVLALYRSGRVADAFEAYRRTRELLIAELGLEPGADLRRLEQAMLDEDPGLLADAADGRADDGLPTEVLVPAELPPVSTIFTGRRDEFALAEKLLRTPATAGPVVVAINGRGGIGKSTLAIQAANSAAAEFPDGQLYANLRGTTPGMSALTARDVLARFLRSLGLTDNDIPTSPEEAATRFRSVTRGRRLLIVLDDAADVAQVRPLIPASPSVAVVVTSRPVLAALDGANQLPLEVLGEDESVALLAELAGTDRVAAEPAAAIEVVRQCDRLPLAVRIAGARLAARKDWTLSAFASRLADAHGRLDELEHADLAVRKNCAVSVEGLAEENSRIFALIGLLDLPSLTAPAVAALAERSLADARRRIDDLVEAQLLHPLGGERYVMHDLIRLFARERASEIFDETQRGQAIRRVLHHYLGSARLVLQAFHTEPYRRLQTGPADGELTAPPDEFGHNDEMTAWIRQEADNLVAAARHAAALPGDGTGLLVGLAAATTLDLDQQRLWSEILQIATLAGHHAEKAGVREWMLRAEGDLSIVNARLERFDDALRHAENARLLSREIGDRFLEATALTNLSYISARKGNDADIVSHGEEALEIFRELGRHHDEAIILINLHVAHVNAKRYDEAEALLLQCRTVAKDDLVLALVAYNLGWIQLYRERPADAIDHLVEGARHFAECGDPHRQALALWDLGDTLSKLERRDEAEVRWRESLDLLQVVGAVTKAEATEILAAPVPQKPAALAI